MNGYEVVVRAGIPRLDFKILPTHRITVAKGLKILHFYYVVETPTSREFTETEDNDVLQAAFDIGNTLAIGEHRELAVSSEKCFTLKRHTASDIILRSIK